MQPEGDQIAEALENVVDVERLTLWLDKKIPQLGDGVLSIAKVRGGTSNIILSLDRGAGSYILRRPPDVLPPNSERTILREAQVLTALNQTDVPHPFCYGVCEDVSVIGAPFYVMERVSGWAAELRPDRIYHPPPFDCAPYEYGIAYAMVDGLVALANVDYLAIGLEGFGYPDNFLGRQVDRWERQLASYEKTYNYPGRALPGYERLKEWLRENTPEDFRPGIIHGDVGTPNALFREGPPAQLSALIDWELSTIGDPMLDLAWFTSGMRDERDPDRIPATALYNAANMPTRQELARYYASGTGRSLAAYDYFLLLAMFKSGCILEHKVAAAASGQLSQEAGEFFSALVLANFEEAQWLIDTIS